MINFNLKFLGNKLKNKTLTEANDNSKSEIFKKEVDETSNYNNKSVTVDLCHENYSKNNINITNSKKVTKRNQNILTANTNKLNKLNSQTSNTLTSQGIHDFIEYLELETKELEKENMKKFN
jgi:hypothetical protein